MIQAPNLSKLEDCLHESAERPREEWHVAIRHILFKGMEGQAFDLIVDQMTEAQLFHIYLVGVLDMAMPDFSLHKVEILDKQVNLFTETSERMMSRPSSMTWPAWKTNFPKKSTEFC